MFINHNTREVTAKIVYYGPGLSGKTTNLQYIFSITNPRSRGELISIQTDSERTLFFDLLPLEVGVIDGYQTKFQLYTVPGQVFYHSTTKLVLKGADGIVFVADSQELKTQGNIESFKRLETSLAEYNMDIRDIPLVFQYNKRDLSQVVPLEELNRVMNPFDYPYFLAVATKGKGVLETLRGVSAAVLTKIRRMLEYPPANLQDIPSSPVPPVTDTVKAMETVFSVTPEMENIQQSFEGLNDIRIEEEDLTLESPQERDSELPDILDALERLKDKTRVTVIKKIPISDSELIIDIKDKDSKVLQSVPISLNPETKKVTLVLDVKE